ncbi:MAG: OmpH family outer membrane protein [Ignavibacteria bacterium]|nr:OmpH family outer membrane protein [Ignavibacteria bacterium]
MRIQKVLERYDGALDAKKAFRTTTMAWGANVDTLRSELQRLVFEYESVGSSNSRLRDSLGLQLRRKEAQIADYSKAVEQKTAQEQQLLTEGVISQVRTAAESVAKSEGVDCFLAVQDDGMLVFALETVDMTDVVLERLRTTYRGQFKPGATSAKSDAGPKP